MSNKRLLTVCLLIIGLHTAAQQTFTGYYINSEGDTTAVSFPGYKQWKNNPAQITVQTRGGQDVVLTPDNSREVTITGYDTYRSRRFTRLTNPSGHLNRYNILPDSDSLEAIHGFLLYLAEAKGISLYKYSDKKRDNYFIEKGDSLVELKQKIYSLDNAQVLDDNTFRQQLYNAFALEGNGTAAVKARLERLEYTEEKLQAFIEQMGGQGTKKEKMYPADFYLLGGVAFNSFNVTWWDYQNAAARADYKGGLGPVVGLAFYEYSQRTFGRNFLTLQLKYYRFSNTGTYAYYTQQGEVKFSSGVINLGVGVGRSLVKTGALTAYAAVLPQVVYLPDSKEKYYDNKEENKLSRLSFNGTLQAGLRLPNGLGFWTHYNLLSLDVRDSPYYDHLHRSLQVGVDLKFNRKQ